MQLFGQTSDLYDEQSADDADEQTFRSERSNIPNSCDIPHKAGTQHALHTAQTPCMLVAFIP